MEINEANLKLMQIGNAIIEKSGFYYVVPRTTTKIKPLEECKSFLSVQEAYDYAIELPGNWEGNEI